MPRRRTIEEQFAKIAALAHRRLAQADVTLQTIHRDNAKAERPFDPTLLVLYRATLRQIFELATSGPRKRKTANKIERLLHRSADQANTLAREYAAHGQMILMMNPPKIPWELPDLAGSDFGDDLLGPPPHTIAVVELAQVVFVKLPDGSQACPVGMDLLARQIDGDPACRYLATTTITVDDADEARRVLACLKSLPGYSLA